MTELPSKNHLQVVASAAIAVAGCVGWMAVQGFRQNHGPTLLDETLGVSSRRILASLLDEDEPIPDLFPFEPADYAGVFCAVTGLILAAGAGIGGGGILVPMFILIFEFPVKHAIPLASVTVLGGAIANNMLNLGKSHPDHLTRPAIDWDLIIQLEPMTIAGTLIGADLNDLLPDVVLVVLLFLLLSATSYKTLQKANKLYDKESEAMEKAEKEAERLLANGPEYGPDVAKPNYGSNGSLSPEPSFGEDNVRQAWLSAAQLTGLFVAVTSFNVMKGGPEEGSEETIGLAACGVTCFWVAEAGIMLLILGFAGVIRHNILQRIENGGVVLSEIEWNETNTIQYPMYAIVAGLVAGMFGVGGGIIKGPLMLALGKKGSIFVWSEHALCALLVCLQPLGCHCLLLCLLLLIYRCPSCCCLRNFCLYDTFHQLYVNRQLLDL